MLIRIPPICRKLFFLSVPLFIIHVVEEYLTLYYPTVFGVMYEVHDLPQETFIRVEIVVITTLLVFSYLLYKNRLPGFLILLPGFLYLYQFEHIYHAFLAGIYYPGLFTGILLIILGLFFWKALILGNRYKKKAKK